MKKILGCLIMKDNTTALDPGGARAVYTGFLTTTATLHKYHTCEDVVVADDVGGSDHSLTVQQNGLYRVVFQCHWTSTADALDVEFDLALSDNSEIPGSYRKWTSGEGSGAGVDIVETNFAIEVIVPLVKGDTVRVYLNGTADATAVLSDAVFLIEAVDR